MKTFIYCCWVSFFLLFAPNLFAQSSKCKKKMACCAEEKNLSSTIDSILKSSNDLAYQQMTDVLSKYFVKGNDDNGNIVYRPIMVQMETERTVIDANMKSKIVKVKFNVPLITLTPVHFLGIDHANIDKKEKPEVGMKEVPLPNGLNIMIEAFVKLIQPVDEH